MNSHQRRVQRRKYYREVKERIENDEYDNTFTSWTYIDNCGYVDFLFLGEYNGVPCIWNACITTARGDYLEHCNSLASDEAYEKFPSTTSSIDGFLEDNIPCEWDERGKPTMYEWKPSPERRELMDKRLTYIAKRQMELLDSGEHGIDRWNIDIDTTYKFGIGLHIRVDLPYINTDDVKRFINDFNNNIHLYDHKDEIINDNAADLGVEICETGKFVRWKEPWTHNTTSLKI